LNWNVVGLTGAVSNFVCGKGAFFEDYVREEEDENTPEEGDDG
jgi:hypothetical protein